MEPREQIVAGLSCMRVLALLSDFIDGELEPAARDQVLAHLQGCDWCERFGGRFATVVADLRRSLKEPEPLSTDIARRLREAIEKAER